MLHECSKDDSIISSLNSPMFALIDPQLMVQSLLHLNTPINSSLKCSNKPWHTIKLNELSANSNGKQQSYHPIICHSLVLEFSLFNLFKVFQLFYSCLLFIFI